ncbi:MAG: AIR synthase-related protein, partial [Acidobacteriota bacterium]
GGMRSNLDHFESRVRIAAHLNRSLVLLMFDPQTSGGLLIAAAPEHAAVVDRALTRAGVTAIRIGEAARREHVSIDLI